jgi:mRNA interferase MazF
LDLKRLSLKRGDVVVGVASRDYGRPRPAVVVQNDFFNETHAGITLCPITSHLVDAPLFRIPVEPGAGTGLRIASQVMVDKVLSVPRERIAKRAGHLPAAVLRLVDEALELWLGIRRQ